MKKNIKWIILAVIVIAALVCGGIWGYGKYREQKRIEVIDKNLLVLKVNSETDTKALLNYGIALHDYGRIDEALTVLKQVMDAVPESTTAAAYYGSTLTKKADRLAEISDKVEALQEGLDIMDKAVTDNPEHFLTRLVRAENNYYLPAMFERIDTSIRDFEYLLGLCASDEKYTSMTPYIMLRLGQACIKAEKVVKGKEVLHELITNFPENNNTKTAQKILKKY